MKNGVFWDVMSCGSCNKRRFGGNQRLHLQRGKNPSVRRLLITANIPSSQILANVMLEAVRSAETSVLTRATRRNIPEDGILHSHCRENLKSYIALTG
jgi:hypothetical protein